MRRHAFRAYFATATTGDVERPPAALLHAYIEDYISHIVAQLQLGQEHLD